MAQRAIAWVIGLLVGFGATLVPCSGHPAFVPLDPPVALVQGDPGRTTFALRIDAAGWEAALARSVAPLCDVVALVGEDDPFELRARIRLPGVPFPVRAELEVGGNAATALGSLSLGPIRIVAARTFGEEVGRRVAVVAASPRLVAIAGAEFGGRALPFVAAAWSLDSVPLWALTLLVSPLGARVTLGGTW